MFSSAIQRLNDRRHAAGEVGEDAGFTLIELMVVLLILAILLAIAIPTFLGVTKSANDRAAQSNLNTGMLNAKAAYQSNSQTYQGTKPVTNTVLQSAEPSLSFLAAVASPASGNSTGQGVLSVFPTTDGNAIILGAFSKSNNCWYQIDNPSGSTAVAGPFNTTFTGANGTVTSLASTTIAFPSNVAGTIYVEVKGDSTLADCNSALPKGVVGTNNYEWSTTKFPTL